MTEMSDAAAPIEPIEPDGAAATTERTPLTAPPGAGRYVVWFDVAGTALFAVTAVFAAAVFSTPAQWIGAVTAVSLFAVGVAVFLWSFWNAVQRSRVEEISVTQLYLLSGPAIPASVRRVMNLTLVTQVVIATVTAFARPNGPDGSPGSSLALGFLVPMFGFGLNGLWAAYHGRFPPRAHDVRTSDVTRSADGIGQNADHG